MKNMMMILALLFAMVGSSFGEHVSDKISKILVGQGGNAYSDQHDIQINLTINPNIRYYIDENQAGCKNMLAALLSAYQSQKEIGIYYEASPSSAGLYKITAVGLGH